MSKYYDKTAASFKSVTIDTKVLDAQKILINSNPNDINQRENLLDVLNEIDVTPSYTSYRYIDYCEKSSNTGDCSAVKLHANLLPHGKNIKAIRLDVANTVATETWLVAYLVDANNNFTSIGKSINSNTWSAGDQVEWEFEEAFQIPEGSYLQFYIADANSTISSTNVTRPSYKIKLYIANESGSDPDQVRYDGTWYGSRRVYVQFKEELKYDLSQYLDYKLDQVQDQVNTNSENIEYLLNEFNSVFTYEEGSFDVNTMNGTLDNATIYGIQYSKEHFGVSNAKLSKITIPYNVQAVVTSAGYLVAQIFDATNQLITSYYSENTHTFSNAGPAEFSFVNADIPEYYKFIRFILVADKSVELPTAYNSINSNCLSFRARPINLSDSFTFDDDDCLIYSNQSTGTQNWLIGMTIDYKQRVENDSDNSEIRITSAHSLGDFYFSMTSHMPEGVLPLNGSEVSRITYSDLYNYVLNIHNELVTSGKKFIVSDEEWQNISIENNGYVPYYSYGSADGMFRLPRMSGYLKATGELDEAGNYVAEGLPNITGDFKSTYTIAFDSNGDGNGAIISPYSPDSGKYGNSTADSAWGYGFTFDASASNPIYGNSEHVTPETNTLFVGVWALVAFTQVGTANLNEIKEILSQCEMILGDSLPLLSSRYDNKGLETSAWKVGDGTWLDGRIYTEAYDKLIEKIAEGNDQYLEMKESELLSPTEFPESYLVDTDGVKFRLPLLVVNERTIIKEYKEGTEWYRIYSDGYLEQGGLLNGSSSIQTVNFLVSFSDTPTLTFTRTTTRGGTSYDNELYPYSVSATNFTFQVNTTALIDNKWFAFGYAASIPPREEWEIDFNYYFKVSHGVDEGRINIEEKLTEFEETAYTRLDEVVEEVSKDYVVHVDKQVGELYFSFDNYCPDGVIPLDGRLVSRATYADLWQWVQEKGLVKDDALITTNDENTVSIFNEDGTVKYCQWYGSGDGSLTFRMPKINGYLGATGDNTLAGQYIAEGLPNITGSFYSGGASVDNLTGAFRTPETLSYISYGNGGGYTNQNISTNFDASDSNSIYGNSEHVIPETNTLFVGVWAITATKAAVFDMRDVEEALKSAESYLMNNVPLMSSRWDRDGLGNLGWVKADGSWVDGRHYTGAYNYCVEKLVSGHEGFIDGQIAVITADNCSKFIVDRIGKRFRLPISNGQRQLVAAYKEGTQWYNIYSDGWIEQGGEIYNNTETTLTVDLLIPFNDTNYTVDKILGIDASYVSSTSAHYSSTWGYTTSSFKVGTHVSNGLNRFRWFAKGYGDILSVSSPIRTSQLYFKLAHEFYVPAQAEIQEKLDLIDNLVTKTDINLPTLSSRWDSDFAENIGWVKSEGQWLNGNVYRDAYDLMVSRIGVNAKFIEATEGTEFTDENADKFLIDTTAVKFRLPLINGDRTLVAHVYQEDTYGHSSYNLYSDGYCTQEYAFYPNATSGTLTLLKSYKDTKYNATMADMAVESESDGSGYDMVSAISGFPEKTNSSIRFSMGSAKRAVNVYAYGMCNIPSISEYNCNNYLYFKLADEVPSTVVNTEQIIADLKQECDDFKNECSQKTTDYQNTMNAILALGSDYICSCLIPDYTTQISTTSAGTITIPYHAFVRIYIQRAATSNGTCDVSINDKVVANMISNNYSHNGFEFYAKKGDVIKTVINNLSSYSLTYWKLQGASAE